MSVCVNGKEYDDEDLENNENNPLANGCFKWQNNEERDASGSQEMFFDDDHIKDSVFCTPRPKRNETLNSSAISLKTPVLCSNTIVETPGRARVPTTPVDLLPFIKKTSFVWTSDMETPESKANEKSNNCNKTVNSIEFDNVTPVRAQHTPKKNEMETKKVSVSSPVLGGKKRTKRKVKRRILTNVVLEENNDQQNSASSNSDQVQSETTSSVSNDLVFDVEPETEKPVKEVKIEVTENKKLEETAVFDKNSNTSTQDFFCNASFTTIDQLCNNDIKKEKESSATLCNQIKVEKEETVEINVNNKEEANLASVSNDVLERVAAIRRNQKPMRRSMDIQQTVVPKEVFSRSVMELELADMKFSQENKKPLAVEQRLLNTRSFTKFSSIKNEVLIKVEKSYTNDNESNNIAHDVPEELMEEWNKTQMEKENIDNLACAGKNKKNSTKINNLIESEIKNSEYSNCVKPNTNTNSIRTTLKQTNSEHLKSDNNNLIIVKKEIKVDGMGDDGFSTASGKNIAISEEKILNYEKIYNEIEIQNLNENSFLEQKNKRNEQKKLQLNFGRKSITKQQNDIKSKTESILLPQASTSVLASNKHSISEKSLANNDGFSTAGGKGITINEDKENLYMKIYNELDDVNDQNLLDAKKSMISKSNTSKRIHDKAVITFNNKSNNLNNHAFKELPLNKIDIPTASINDGFSTACGKGIKINNKVESHYQKIYDGFDDVDESNFLNKKKNTISKPLNKPTDKAVLIFNKPTDKAVLIFNKAQNNLSTTTSKNILQSVSESSTSKESADGFATAGGKGIKINDDKANYYLKLYNEMDDAAVEQDLLNIKKNKLSNSNNNTKTNTKSLVVFNAPKNKTNVVSDKSAIIKEFSSDSFATASGVGIKVNEEKEKHYMNIFNELSDDVNFANSKSNKHEYPKLDSNDQKKSKLENKPSTEQRIKTENMPITSKLSISSDTDDVFLDIGDIETLFAIQDKPKSNEVNNDDCFTIPNATNVPKKSNQISTISYNAQISLINAPIKQEGIINIDSSLQNHQEQGVMIGSNQEKSQIGRLKRKLEGCEGKKPERCRSFGGFPISESIMANKLNKSDPQNESFVNQPLQNGLSVSQCFDSHSDSWLSKVEISYLNNSRIKSPDVRVKTEPTEPQLKISNNHLGFTYKDCTESFRQYASYKRFLDKLQSDNSFGREINCEVGHTIAISNQTLSNQRLYVLCEDNVEFRKGMNQSSFILVECPVYNKYKPLKDYEPIVKKKAVANTNQSKVNAGHKVAEKRKHVDTDSDNTPLTTVKKPKVGSELQGRRLFSDESDNEEQNQVENVNNELVEPKEAQALPIEIEEVDLSEERLEATLKQDKLIRNKKRIKIKPTMGELLCKRLANSKNRKSWTDIVGDDVPKLRSIEEIKKIHSDGKVLEVTASNAMCYKFLSSNIVGNKKVVSLNLDDGAVLVFDVNGHAGVNEFVEAFLAMPGIDPKLVPNGWVENHYRWIVWKLACIDRIRFNSIVLPKLLTPDRLMRELKYRYDREIDKAERPALRKILEKDDPPSRRMVLCVSSIKECTTTEEMEKEARLMLGLPHWKVEVTDGWYDIPLTLDNEMANFIANGKIKEGTKIVTYGAELLECERGFFPLEKPPNVSLKIHTNCTRRARWYAKLGYQKNSAPIPAKLRDVLTGGGMVGEITAVIARVYPVLYREKTADGRSIYRNARCEERAAIAHEQALESKVDAMYAEAEKNYDSKKNSDADEDFDSSLPSSSKVQGASKSHNHWERKQEEFKRRIESQVRKTLPPPRKVTAVLKVRLLDDKSTATITIWGASEDSEFDMKEGQTISVYNAFATGSRNGEPNLTANRITHIKPQPLIRLPYPNRICTLIPDIGSSSFDPKFSEFDTVGVVVSSGAAPHGMKNFEMVNFAYPRANNAGSAYLTILFWNGISSFGYQGMFVVGTFFACSNLEWRRLTWWNVAVAYCSEKTIFTINPRQSHLMKELRNLKALVHNPVTYAESCVEELTQELTKKPQSRASLGTPSNTLDRTSFYNTSIVSPMDNFSPSNVSIQRRLEKLSRYGSTPEVSPIVLNSSSERLKKDYTPVTRSNT